MICKSDASSQRDEARIKTLEARIEKLERMLEQRNFWTDYEPLVLGSFKFNSQDPTFFKLPADLPQNTKEVLILTFIRCGNEGPSRSFLVKLWTEIQQTKFTKYVKGARYPQNAISFSSESIPFPVGDDRKVYVQCNDVQLHNCHHLELILVGYR